MRRSIPFRIGFLSVLSSFVLLLGMFTFTGTASAHTATSSDVNPHIRAFVLSVGSRCVDLEVVGRGFSQFGRADFFAFSRGRELLVDPESVRANGRGRFSTDVT